MEALLDDLTLIKALIPFATAIVGGFIGILLKPIVQWHFIEKRKMEIEERKQQAAQQHEREMEMIAYRRDLIERWRTMVVTLSGNYAHSKTLNSDKEVRAALQRTIEFSTMARYLNLSEKNAIFSGTPTEPNDALPAPLVEVRLAINRLAEEWKLP